MIPKKTALYQCHLDCKAQMVEFAHTLLPVRYHSEKDEHVAVRHSVGMFDVSHMGEFFIEGPHAHEFLQGLLTNNLDRLVDHQAQYSLLLNERGGIIDDLIVYRLGGQKYLLCVNAANIERDWHHVSSQASLVSGLVFKNASDEYGQIALQGPKAYQLIKSLTDDKIPERFFIERIKISGIDTLTARTGYTGEDGFEIFVANNQAPRLWNSLLDRGQAYEVKPCGLAARDSLRLEAGLLLHGQDMDETTTPLEARLMFAVDMTKPHFIGKDALVKQKAAGLTKKLMGFTMLDRGIARHGFNVFDQHHQEIGVVTSGTFPPQKSYGLGLAYILATHAKAGQEILIDIRGRMAKARIVPNFG
jgi:aminomethyltransferase